MGARGPKPGPVSRTEATARVRVSREELEAWRAVAALGDLTVSEWLRLLAWQAALRAADGAEGKRTPGAKRAVAAVKAAARAIEAMGGARGAGG